MKFNALKQTVFFSFLLAALLLQTPASADEILPLLPTDTLQPATADNSPVVFQSLEQMDELVRLGMPALALRLLSQEQQKWPVYSADWYAFERKHITLLSALESWQALIERAESLLNKAIPQQQITPQAVRWFQTQQVMAWLRMGQSDRALSQLRDLLWHAAPEHSDPGYSDMIALWRRLVIRAYLMMDADLDAQKALLRYQYDYSHNHQNLNLEWRLLQARSLLRTGRAEEAVTLLAGAETHHAQALRLVAAVRARPESAALYAQEAEVRIVNEKLNAGEIWAYRYVLYQAWLAQKKLGNAAQVLQQLLVMPDAYTVLGEEFIVSGDELWQLYEIIGQQSGNRARLLLGDDMAWYQMAGEQQKKNSVEALSLYVVLAFHASDVNQQQLAHKEIVALLEKEKNGLELVNQLYLHGTKISSLERVPLEVRYSLLDYALSKSDTKLAVRLMQSVQQPPQGQDEFLWAMRKARVMILEGLYTSGEDVLKNTVNNTEQMTAQQLDQLLQVIFDLQAVGRHQQVLALLAMLKAEWLNADIDRELFFWKAESYYALEQYDRAAWSYLKSAQLAEQSQNLLWAESARFNAAGALVKSGLYDDAQVLYTRLLSATASDSRKSAIRQQLQQIRLLRNAANSNANEH